MRIIDPSYERYCDIMQALRDFKTIEEINNINSMNKLTKELKEKETMSEDNSITKCYPVIDDFYKDVLGIDPPKPKSEWVPFKKVRKYNIADYEYTKDENNGVAITTIRWHNGDTTTCRAPLDKADQYTGFMIAVAKYAMGNKNEATNTADYWINKRPVQLAKFREKVKAEEAEIKRITDKRRKRREQYRLRLAAIRRKEAYEAAKLANEKYGVPLNFKEDGEDK